jgi:nucleoside triphosphate pyrophosphatase
MNSGAELLGLDGSSLVLASTSPRRMELLASLGIAFTVRATVVDESVHPGEDAEVACMRLAEAKALAANVTDPSAWVLGADTVVVQDGVIFGKPQSDAEAAHMLRQLSGSAHEVWTGLAIRRVRDSRMFTAAERTRVWFDVLPESVIELMVRSGEGRDKAGAYGIQGLAGLFVSRIDGDYYNVMGLPLSRLRRLCMEAR